MAIVKRIPLSASTNGTGIVVAQTATPGTLIHTATNTIDEVDEVWLWAYNSDNANATLSIEWVNATLPRKVTIPLQTGLVPIIPGLILLAGSTVKISANGPNIIMIDGFVNRITNS
jgi:hypothetical protein